MTTIKTLGYTFLALAMAMAVTGCKGKTEEASCCGTCKDDKPAVEAPAEVKIEEAKPAAPVKAEKPMDQPAK